VTDSRDTMTYDQFFDVHSGSDTRCTFCGARATMHVLRRWGNRPKGQVLSYCQYPHNGGSRV
jgi:hypothetical protein